MYVFRIRRQIYTCGYFVLEVYTGKKQIDMVGFL